jgi:hypothetical protein
MESRTGVICIHYMQIHTLDFCRHTRCPGWVCRMCRPPHHACWKLSPPWNPGVDCLLFSDTNTSACLPAFFSSHHSPPRSPVVPDVIFPLSWATWAFPPSSTCSPLTQDSQPSMSGLLLWSLGDWWPYYPHTETSSTHGHAVPSDWYLGLVLFLFPACCGDKFTYPLKKKNYPYNSPTAPP